MSIRMRRRVVVSSLLVFIVTALAGIKLSGIHVWTSRSSPAPAAKSDDLVVHEWGTFTSIAGKDGVALEWRPLNGASDLPGFVHTSQQPGAGLRHPYSKGDLISFVRMETPVIYFYSNQERDVSVKIDFPKGKITEWYPLARSVGQGINWGRFKITPGAALNLPVEYSNNRYYAARETDAAPVQVCSTNGKATQQEKFLFYRGVGTFDLPISVKLDGDNLIVRNSGDEISSLIVFENRDGKIGYRLYDHLSGELIGARPELNQDLGSLITNLQRALVASGLYEKEAEAMIKTWRDSWFESGLRVFYVLPRHTIDAVLPITIDPQPQSLVRVLVGRTEVITPEMEKSVRLQVHQLSDPAPRAREAAARNLRQSGRFYEPIIRQLLAEERDLNLRRQLQNIIKSRGAESRQTTGQAQ